MSKHNPRKCRLCGSVRNGLVLMKVRKGLARQTRSNGENAGSAK